MKLFVCKLGEGTHLSKVVEPNKERPLYAEFIVVDDVEKTILDTKARLIVTDSKELYELMTDPEAPERKKRLCESLQLVTEANDISGLVFSDVAEVIKLAQGIEMTRLDNHPVGVETWQSRISQEMEARGLELT